MEAIIKDVDWLTEGYKEEIRYASDCFQEMYDAAVRLIKRGKAYISTLSADELQRARLKSSGVRLQKVHQIGVRDFQSRVLLTNFLLSLFLPTRVE